MRATTSLRADHDIIEKVLRALEATVSLFKEGKEIPIGILKDTLDFVTNFIDRCHHSKEENGLFPALNARGLPKDQGPIAVMLMEHEEGRKLAEMMKSAIDRYANDPNAKNDIISIAESYIALLSHHIWKENNILFNLADSLLSDKAEEMTEQLEKIEEEKIGRVKHEEYAKFAERVVESIKP